MSLKHYSQIALKESRLTSEAELNSVRLLEGDLKPEGENLILAYAGSFNPPHRGHIDVLLSALRREIGAIAIIIVPSEDFFLRNKIRDKHPEFFLSQKRRVDILNAIPSIPKDRVWVWPSTWYPFKSYTKAMARVAEADGLNVRFSWLIGPDLLNPQDATFVVPYSLQGVLVSNKARHVGSHFLPNGKPAVWKGFGKWDCKTSVETSGNPLVDDREVVMWRCTSEDENSGKRGYYLEHKMVVSHDINSTDLRKGLVQNGVINEMILNDLSTEDLMEFLSPILQEK